MADGARGFMLARVSVVYAHCLCAYQCVIVFA